MSVPAVINAGQLGQESYSQGPANDRSFVNPRTRGLIMRGSLHERRNRATVLDRGRAGIPHASLGPNSGSDHAQTEFLPYERIGPEVIRPGIPHGLSLNASLNKPLSRSLVL